MGLKQFEVVGNVYGTPGGGPPTFVHARGNSSSGSVAPTYTDMYGGGGSYPESTQALPETFAGLAYVDGPAVRVRIGSAKSVRPSMTMLGTRGVAGVFSTRRSGMEGDWDSPPSWRITLAPAPVGAGVGYQTTGDRVLNYLNGTWVIVVESVRSSPSPTAVIQLWYSTDDGVTWSRSPTGFGPTPIYEVMWVGSRWVAAQATGSQTVMYSGTSLASLTFAAGDIFAAGSYRLFAHSSSIVVGVAGTKVLVSTSGGASGSWVESTPTYPAGSSAHVWEDLTYCSATGQFVGVGYYSIAPAGTERMFVATSTNGTSWTFTTTATNAFPLPQSVAGNGSLLVRGIRSTVVTGVDWYESSDGITWTLDSTATGLLGPPRCRRTADGDLYRWQDHGGGGGTINVERTTTGTWVSVGSVGNASAFYGQENLFDVGPVRPPRDLIVQARSGGTWGDVVTLWGDERDLERISGPAISSYRDGFAGITPPSASTEQWRQWGPNGLSWPTSATNFVGGLHPFGTTKFYVFSASSVRVYDLATDSYSDTIVPTINRLTVLGADNAFYQFRYGSVSGSGLFRSTDGFSWTQILTDDPANYGGQVITGSLSPNLACALDSGILGLAFWTSASSGTWRYLSAVGDYSGGFSLQSTVTGRGNGLGLRADGCFAVAETAPTRLYLSDDLATWDMVDFTGADFFFSVIRCTGLASVNKVSVGMLLAN